MRNAKLSLRHRWPWICCQRRLCGRPLETYLSPPTDFTAQSCVNDCGVVVKRVMIGSCEDPKVVYPVSEKALACFLAKGDSYENLAEQFMQEHTQLAKVPSRSQSAQPPSNPLHPRWRVTPEDAEDRRERLEAELRAYLPNIIGPLKMVDFAWAGMVLRFSAGDFNVHLCSATGNSFVGAVPFRANFFQLKILRNLDCGGIELQIERKAHIASRRKLPFSDDLGVGIMVHHSYWSIAAMMFEDGRGTQKPLEVRVVKLRHTPVGCDRYIVHGEDTDVRALRVVFDEKIVEDADSSAPGPEEVNWESDLLPKRTRTGTSVSQPRRRGEGRRRAPATEQIHVLEEFPDLFSELALCVEEEHADVLSGPDAKSDDEASHDSGNEGGGVVHDPSWISSDEDAD